MLRLVSAIKGAGQDRIAVPKNPKRTWRPSRLLGIVLCLLLLPALDLPVLAMGSAKRPEKGSEPRIEVGKEATNTPEAEKASQGAPSGPPAQTPAPPANPTPANATPTSATAVLGVKAPHPGTALTTGTASATALTSRTAGAAPLTSGTASAAALTSGTAALAPKDDGLIALNLMGANIQQILKFISDNTKKPIMKPNNVNASITVSAPGKVTVQEALDLIYDALLMEGFAVLESENRIQIVPVGEVKDRDIITVSGPLPPELRKQKSRLVRRIIPVQSTSASAVMTNLLPVMGKYSSIVSDARSNALIIIDTVRNLERYEKILNEIDVQGFDRIEMEMVPVVYAEASEICDIVLAFLRGATRSGSQPSGGQPSGFSGPSGREGGGGGGGPVSATILPVPRTNSVLVVASKEMLPNILRLIKQLDIEKPKDVRVRVLPLEHAESASVSRAIERLFPAKRDQAEKDKVQVISDGTEGAVVVVASDQNYALIKELVGQLDTKNAQKSETRRFELKYLDAQDTADQLSQLYGQMKNRSSSYYEDYYGGYNPYSSRSRSSKQEVSFVPVAQSNTILAIAPPSEFALIESLIKELDQPISKDEVLPEIYRIKNADATQVEKLLNTIFGNAQQGSAYDDPYYPFSSRWRSGAESQTQVGRLAGKVRFSSDTNTNSIIAVSNNKSVYEIVKEIIDGVDRAMPELANTLIIALEHSDAVEMAKTLNILFGRPVQPQQRPQQQRTNPSGGTDSGGPAANEEVITGSDFSAWWGQTAQQGRGEKELPISNLIERVRFVPDPRTNSLLVVTASHNYEVIKSVVSDLDKQESQALVKIRIVEIRKEGTKKLGLRWMPAANLYSPEDLDSAVRVLGGLELIDAVGGGADKFGNVAGNVTGVPSTLPGGSTGHSYTKEIGKGRGILASNINMDLLMQLLIRNLDSKVQSDPMLYMSNNTPGEIFAGDNVPRVKNSESTPQGGSRTVYGNEDVGITLRITPHINKTGTVVMSVYLQTSRLTGEQRGGSDILQSRRYTTELAVKSGETMVLGGITLDTKQKIVRKIPLLGDIPLLGYLFRNYDTVNSQSDVYVFITPQVVSSENEAREIAGEALVKFNGKDKVKVSVKDSGKDAKEDFEKSSE